MHSSRPVSVAFAVIGVVLALGQSPQTQAARAPWSPEKLLAESDIVVVAEVTEIEIQKERSRIERGFGNYDWAIYLTLRVQEVEKGSRVTTHEDVVVRCFLIKTRKSSIEYLTRGGHDPIPEIGQTVRAYVQRDGDDYVVIDPNGFTSIDGTQLVQAADVKELRRGGFTYFLPLDILITGTVLMLLIVAVVINVCRLIAHWRAARRSGEPPCRIRFSTANVMTTIFFVAFGFAGQSWVRAPAFAFWLGLLAFSALLWFTVRPPRTSSSRLVWWGINSAFVSAYFAAILW